MDRFPRFIGGRTTVTSLCILALWVIFNGVGRADWKADWEKTVAAAKKEGQLNFYVGRYGTEPLLNEFRKDYPEIKIISVNATGNQLGTRIISEIRAGKVIADLYSGGANTNYEILYKGKALDSIRSALILPEVVDESKWYGGQHRYTDPEQKFIFVYIATPSSSGFYYNTALVNSKEFKSYWDLVNPKWKGKYVSQDPTSTGLGGGMQFHYYHPELGPEFIKRLFGDMQPTFGRDRRQITDWLAQGRFLLCVGCRDATRAKTQGLPVDEFNWFLSRKGQTALQKYADLYGEEPPNSRRVDIPKDILPPLNRLVPGKKYFDVSDPKYADMEPIFKLVKEIMKSREQKKE